MRKTTVEKRVRDLESVIVIASLLILLSLILHRHLLVIPAFALLISGILLKKFTSMVSDGWLRVSGVIADFNNRVLLTAVFFLVLTPVALIYRLFNGKGLRSGKNEDAESYFSTRDREFKKEDFEKIW